jgi:plastocyanin
MRRAGHLVLAFALVAAVAVAPAGVAHAQGSTESVSAKDNFFDADVVRVPAGSSIEWTNDGRSPHNVTADDGSFASETQAPGDTFTQAFPTAGVFRYYCTFHGSPGGIGMSGIVLVGDAALPSAGGGTVGPGREPVPTTPGTTRTVPAQYLTIQEAVNAAKPGDLILVSPGVYEEAVQVTTPYLTIRGTNRNTVILDGGFTRANGIHVIDADGVVVENMTARNYLLNGFYWTGVQGYRASYVTAYNDGDYGVYAFDSVYGRFEHSYASGHPDSGFYVGQCFPCHAVIDDVLAERNGIGYSGTNAGGDLKIVNSTWRFNQGGIVPNSLDSEANPPQRAAYIAGNQVYDNNNQHAPAKDVQAAALGTGILLAGGWDNVVERNAVWNHDNYGIEVSPILDTNFWIPQGNTVRDNLVHGSGRADLALSGPTGKDNCFEGNDFQTSLPPAIQLQFGCGFNLHPGGGGELSSTFQTLALFIRVMSKKYPQGDWRTQPVPPDQPNMPDAETAPVALAVPGEAVPGTVEVHDIGQLQNVGDLEGSKEVTVLGISFLAAPTWWSLLLTTYAYLMPLILLVAWIAIAFWDLIRQESVPNRRKITWMLVILLVPLIGPILYFIFGKSPIPASLRTMLVAGALGVYVLITLLAVLVGGS